MRYYVLDRSIEYDHWSMYLRVADENVKKTTGGAALSPRLLLRLSKLQG